MQVASPSRLARTGGAVRPRHGRRHNLSLVRQTLYFDGPMSRADLARATGLTRVTISDLVTELLASGHARELGISSDVRPGKPSTLLDINRPGLQIVSLDLTAHRVLRGAVLDLDGVVLARTERVVDDSVATVDLADVLDLAARTVARATAPLLGVGVGSPGLVSEEGVVRSASNLGWTNVPLRAQLAEATGLPVQVANDAAAAARASYTLGGASDDFMLIRIGRGVGSGLVIGGAQVLGAHHAAGELGHVTVGNDGGTLCRCGKVGCLETWLSAPSLERALAADPDSDAPLVEAGHRLGIAVAPVVAALDLSQIVLSGPTHLLRRPLVDAVQDTIDDRLLRHPDVTVAVSVAADPDDIVLRGAAVLVLSNRLGVA